MRPIVASDWWQIAGNPDLGTYGTPEQQPVDFGVWQAADGTWQLWSCVRHTGCGGRTRLFYGWEGTDLEQPDWTPTGIAMEVVPALGETPGGLHERMLRHYGIRTDGVEIDPDVVRVAADHFGCTAEVTVADGRSFLNGTPKQYDAIILDAFLGGVVLEHLYTREAFVAARDCLNAEGLLAIHLIGRPDHPAVRAVARTAEAVFPHLAAVRSGIGGELQQIYVFARRAIAATKDSSFLSCSWHTPPVPSAPRPLLYRFDEGRHVMIGSTGRPT